jgi:hypothetical protein
VSEDVIKIEFHDMREYSTLVEALQMLRDGHKECAEDLTATVEERNGFYDSVAYLEGLIKKYEDRWLVQ